MLPVGAAGCARVRGHHSGYDIQAMADKVASALDSKVMKGG